MDRPFSIGAFRVEPRANRIESSAGSQRLEPKAMEVLCLLASRRGQVVSREELLELVWQGAFVSDGVLNRAVHLVRRALGDPARGGRYLETIPRRGLRLLPPVVWEREASDRELPGPPVVLVLPFSDLSAERFDYYVEGVTELLIAELARQPSLRVISRTSAMALEVEQRLLPEVAAAVGASHVVEGTVQRRNRTLRLTAQLIEAATDQHLWARAYDRDLDDLLVVQAELAASIADTVGSVLAPSAAGSRHARPSDPATIELFLRGIYAWNRRSQSGFEEAMRRFEAVLARDPEHVGALTALGQVYVTAALYGFLRPRLAFRSARASTEKALALDPESGDALGGMAAIHLFGDWDFRRAEARFRESVERSPSNAIVRLGYADTLAATGNSAEAISMIESAVRLDPLDAGMVMNRGDILGFCGRHEEALRFHLRAHELDPSSARVSYRLAHRYRLAGRPDQALDLLQRAAGLPGFEPWALFEHAMLDAREPGRREAARRVLAEGQLPPMHLAQLATSLGEHEQALGWLERAFEAGAPWAVFVGVEPDLAPLREHPGLLPLARRFGLEAALEPVRCDAFPPAEAP
ncbi:MAG TPA: tetratricopeptide repeat protein [Thermoanaerobaculia bacterium]|nr:tetratricopeptide repeat protein [Thermoanaerobaculia bacterium]